LTGKDCRGRENLSVDAIECLLLAANGSSATELRMGPDADGNECGQSENGLSSRATVFTGTSGGGGDFGKGALGVTGLDEADIVIDGKSSAGSFGGSDVRFCEKERACPMGKRKFGSLISSLCGETTEASDWYEMSDRPRV
jgi:hypothetical protein